MEASPATLLPVFLETQNEIESGFLPRFIFCNKPSLIKLDYSFFRPDIDADKWDQAYQIFKKVSDLHSGAVAPGKAGVEILDDWYINHQREKHNSYFPDELKPFWRRLEGYLLKFSLIFHQFKRATGEEDNNVISTQTIKESIILTNYFKGQAQSVVETLFKTAEDKQKDQILATLKKLGGEATVREIQRTGKRWQGKVRELNQTLKVLAEEGKIELINFKGDSGQKITKILLKSVDRLTPSPEA